MRIDEFIERLNGGTVVQMEADHGWLQADLVRVPYEVAGPGEVHEDADFVLVTRQRRAQFRVLGLGKPPLFLQCDPLWAGQRYAPGGRRTFCQAGCLVCSAASLVAWTGEYAGVSPVTFAAAVGVEGGFVRDELGHPSAVERVFGRLKWHGRGDGVFWSERYQKKETSFIDWQKRPADVGLLRDLLERQPVVVEVDYKPPTKKVDQHFVLAYKYVEDPEGGLNDDLLVMDPMTGFTSVLTYFNPAWLGAWMEQNEVTKVGRTLMGARVWEVVG
jgi:hypothetical protein